MTPLAKALDNHSKLTLFFIILFWVFLASYYVAITPDGIRNRDFPAHTKYTQMIAETGRIPAVTAGWETWQPPLYYWICSVIAPHHAQHVLWVRCLSILYGCLSLFYIWWFLSSSFPSTWGRTLILLFTATTPTFFMMFTIYSNDPLSILLNIVLVGTAFKFWEEANPHGTLLIFLLAFLGFFTKYTTGLTMAVLSILAIFLYHRGAITLKTLFQTLAPFGAVGGIGLAWLSYRNVLTGEYFVSNFHSCVILLGRVSYRDIFTPTRPPLWWNPYVQFSGPYSDQTNDYLSYLFLSSIFGEFRPGFHLNHRMPYLGVWALVLIHFVSSFFAFYPPFCFPDSK